MPDILHDFPVNAPRERVFDAFATPEGLNAWWTLRAPGEARVGSALTPIDGGTHVRFWHEGWPEANAHDRTSSFCWAMYLRLLKKYVETDEVVAYERRLEA